MTIPNELEKIKDEILTEIGFKKKEQKKLSWGSLTVTIVLVALTLFSIVQTVQSASILKKINGGEFNAAAATNNPPASGGSLPANIQNLPNMVGGC